MPADISSGTAADGLGAGANSASAVATANSCGRPSRPASAIARSVPILSQAASKRAASLSAARGGPGSILISNGFPSSSKKYFSFG